MKEREEREPSPNEETARRMTPEVIELVARRFWILSEPARLKILGSLLEQERTVTELVEDTGLNQANLSKHLQVLRTHGFVARRKEGLFSYYSVSDASVSRLCDIMCARLDDRAREQVALLGTP